MSMVSSKGLIVRYPNVKGLLGVNSIRLANLKRLNYEIKPTLLNQIKVQQTLQFSTQPPKLGWVKMGTTALKLLPFLSKGRLIKYLGPFGMLAASAIYFPGAVSVILLSGVVYGSFKLYTIYKHFNGLIQNFTNLNTSSNKTKEEMDQNRAYALQSFPIGLMGLFQNIFPTIGKQAEKVGNLSKLLHKNAIQVIFDHLDNQTSEARQLSSELFGSDIKNEIQFDTPSSTGFVSATGRDSILSIEFIAYCGNNRLLIRAEGTINSLNSQVNQQVEIEDQIVLNRVVVFLPDMIRKIEFDPNLSKSNSVPHFNNNVKEAEYREISKS